MQEERDLDGYEGGEASGQAQYQEEEEEVNSSGIAAAVWNRDMIGMSSKNVRHFPHTLSLVMAAL